MKRKICLRTYLFVPCAVLFGLVSGRVAAQVPSPTSPKSYSVLAAGPALKVSVQEYGVYKITYENLVSAGLISAPVATDKLAVFGNISGELPYYNTDIYDDLAHLPLEIYDADNDGMFEAGDYLLFYGEAQTRWVYDKNQSPAFTRVKNPYSDRTCYFVSTYAEYPARVAARENEDGSGSEITSFPERILHETDLYNLCSGGQTWYGERFTESGAVHNITLSAPDAVGNDARLFMRTAAKTSTGYASFDIRAGNNSYTIEHGNTGGDDCADIETLFRPVSTPSGSLDVQMSYTKNSTAEYGWLDYIILYYTRKLVLRSASLNFRSVEAISGDVKFRIEGPENMRVWDVSDIYAVSEPALETTGNSRSFYAKADNTLHEYVAFNPGSCPAPDFIGIVQAQNLHEKKDIDYVVVTHPDLLSYARRLAEFHEENDGYRTLCLTTDLVYNEFSSGSVDPSALRLLMRKLKQNSDTSRAPRFLCLFGDASPDYRDINGTVTNFVPTIESCYEGSEGGGTPLDDNFAYLDDDEGISPATYRDVGKLDIAVGRLPVASASDAETVLEKIAAYGSSAFFGKWKNEITLVTDDEFEGDMEKLILQSNAYMQLHPELNLNKLYSDSYLHQVSSTNARIPTLENDLRNGIENSYFVGYLGHSAWNAWADEKILTNYIIESLNNTNSYPVITASSCTFAYFDNDEMSGAERLVLKKDGGAIAVLGTSRTASRGAIESVHSRFLYLLTEKDTETTIGEACMNAKNTANQGVTEKFVLLGDPGLKTALPKHTVKTVKIPDTLKALQTVEAEGCITDKNGNLLNDFNGEVFIQVFDKPTTRQTLGQYNARERRNNPVVSYTLQNSLIFQGTTEVKDGRFSFSFIVPKDIQYEYGFGKINYYAISETADANGAYEDITVGGIDESIEIGTDAPRIELFMDGPSSRGNHVGKDPVLYAKISDEFGLNITGTGIGHNMTLVVDGDEDNPIVVNNLFQYDLGSHTSGNLSYRFLSLEPGTHTAKLKVWNILNISATASISFHIDTSHAIAIYDLLAAPNPNPGNYVDFYFMHNGESGNLTQCDIQIFNLQGLRIAELHYDLQDKSGHAVGPLRWEIRNRLQAGIYIYRIAVTDRNGNKTQKSDRIVIM